jgi:hypothetical protein
LVSILLEVTIIDQEAAMMQKQNVTLDPKGNFTHFPVAPSTSMA